MNKQNRRKSSILAIVIVATAALTLLTYTSLTHSALAAKPSSSEKRGFKNLTACELNAASSHSGQLTEAEVADCYLHAFSGSPISSSSGIGHNDASHNQAVSDNTNDTNTVSKTLSHTDSSGSDNSHHHHDTSSPHNPTDSKMKSSIGQ
jgi:hypothetical protein